MNIADQEYLEGIPLDRDCKLAGFHPLGLLAFDKASGVKTHPNSEQKAPSRTLLRCRYDLAQEKYSWIDRKGNHREFFLVHRLDSPTSGVIVGSQNRKLAEELKNLFARQQIFKAYYALVKCNARIKEGVWSDLLEKSVHGSHIRVSSANKGVTAITEVKMLKAFQSACGALALIELRPKTGRTHQLRVQCAKRNLPILGDRTYGDFSLNRNLEKNFKLKRLCLHSANVSIKATLLNEAIDWKAEAPIPEIFRRIIS